MGKHKNGFKREDNSYMYLDATMFGAIGEGIPWEVVQNLITAHLDKTKDGWGLYNGKHYKKSYEMLDMFETSMFTERESPFLLGCTMSAHTIEKKTMQPYSFDSPVGQPPYEFVFCHEHMNIAPATKKELGIENAPSDCLTAAYAYSQFGENAYDESAGSLALVYHNITKDNASIEIVLNQASNATDIKLFFVFVKGGVLFARDDKILASITGLPPAGFSNRAVTIVDTKTGRFKDIRGMLFDDWSKNYQRSAVDSWALPARITPLEEFDTAKEIRKKAVTEIPAVTT